MLAQAVNEVMEIRIEEDIMKARIRAKTMAKELGFNRMDETRIATAISELTRNALQYAGGGIITIKVLDESQEKKGIEFVVEDKGPGIEDLQLALKGGYSTAGGLGLGLSGSKKLMDDFDITTKVGEGTIVKITKWL